MVMDFNKKELPFIGHSLCTLLSFSNTVSCFNLTKACEDEFYDSHLQMKKLELKEVNWSLQSHITRDSANIQTQIYLY